MITISPIRVSAIQSYNRQKTGKSQNKLSFKSNQLGVLEKEYISLIKNSKSNPVKSFLALSADSGSLKTLFNNILQNEETGFEFIKDAIKNPRENIEIAKRISDKIGNSSNIFFTFAYGTPYVKTYENYINKVYNEAKSFEELFKIRPDWSGESLLDKNLALNKQEFELGKIPYDLPKEDLFLIINYLKQFMQGSGAKKPVNIDNL